MPKNTAIVPVDQIESRILSVRNHRVMLDSDLAELLPGEYQALE
jgi:hypothetical protein